MARANPGAVTYGSTGNGSSMHLAGAMLATATGTQLTHVPYTSPAAVTDVLSGRLNAMFLGAPGAVPLSRGGEIHVLAVLSESRAAVLPEVPTSAEGGYPGVVMGTWFAWLAPKGNPAPDRRRAQRGGERDARQPGPRLAAATGARNRRRRGRWPTGKPGALPRRRDRAPCGTGSLGEYHPGLGAAIFDKRRTGRVGKPPLTTTAAMMRVRLSRAGGSTARDRPPGAPARHLAPH